MVSRVHFASIKGLQPSFPELARIIIKLTGQQAEQAGRGQERE